MKVYFNIYYSECNNIRGLPPYNKQQDMRKKHIIRTIQWAQAYYIRAYSTNTQCATIAATNPPMVCERIAFDVSSR